MLEQVGVVAVNGNINGVSVEGDSSGEELAAAVPVPAVAVSAVRSYPEDPVAEPCRTFDVAFGMVRFDVEIVCEVDAFDRRGLGI